MVEEDMGEEENVEKETNFDYIESFFFFLIIL
jgi:hypothetical protein